VPWSNVGKSTGSLLIIGLTLAGVIAAMSQWRLPRSATVATVCLLFAVLLLFYATFMWLITAEKPTATIVDEARMVLATTCGVVLVLWGQAFVALAFIASWRLVFPPHQSLPVTVGAEGPIPSVSDVVELIQALTVAPTWLGMTVIGIALTGVGAWLIRHAQPKTMAATPAGADT
jgi:hypothetical protein